MKPDLIITHIKHCDYPIFRGFLMSHRDWFNKVIILFSEHNRFPYFDHFIHDSLKNLDITWLDSKQLDWGKEDWRNVATNEMLKCCDSEWVCSIEQDFFTDDWEKLWTEVKNLMGKCEYFGWRAQQGSQPHQDYLTRDYVHPSFWFIKRDLLDKTNRDFSADPQRGADHFGLIVREVEKLGVKPVYMQDLGFTEWEKAFHLGGVNQNYLNIDNPDYVFHRPDIFSAYNYWSMECNVLQDDRHMKLCKKIAEKLPKPDNKWEVFFR